MPLRVADGVPTDSTETSFNLNWDERLRIIRCSVCISHKGTHGWPETSCGDEGVAPPFVGVEDRGESGVRRTQLDGWDPVAHSMDDGVSVHKSFDWKLSSAGGTARA